MIIDSLKKIVRENAETDPLYLRNLLKENLQYYVLNFIYNSRFGENLLLKGGSCLRMFFGLPRMSEDLDLDLDIQNRDEFLLPDFLAGLEKYFSAVLLYKEIGITASAKENIIKLKFPILGQLGLAKGRQESKILFLRIDLAQALGRKYQSELSLKSTYDFSFLVKRYSLSALFAGKLAAILGRTTKGERGSEGRIKGRDYFDLAWFLEKKISLNFSYLEEITPVKNRSDLKARLRKKVKDLDLEILRQDLIPLFRDRNFVQNFVSNYKKLVLGLIEESSFCEAIPHPSSV